MIAGEELGNWRWAGLLALSELRHLRHVGDLGAAARQNDELAQHLDTIGEAAEDLGASTKQFIDGVADAAPCLLKNSFDADTPVQTPDGEVPISEITVGSLVFGYDEATGKTGTFTVTDVISHTDPLQIKLTLDGEQIDTTPEHPFFVLLRGWVDAGELQVGDQVRTLDGDYGTVEAVEVVAETEVMYNLTVAQAHTFFIGEEGWLVHNTSCNLLSDDELIALAKDKAARQQKISAGNGVVTVFQLPNGSVFEGGSSRLDQYPVRQEIMDLYQNNPCKDGFAGGCGEARAMSRALDAGYSLEDLRGGTMVSVYSRKNSSNDKHLQISPPCTNNCQIVLPQLGIRWV